MPRSRPSRGSDAVRRIVRAARRLGVRALTLYAFSEQNWARPDLEVDALMELLSEFLLSERDEILRQRHPPATRSATSSASRPSCAPCSIRCARTVRRERRDDADPRALVRRSRGDRRTLRASSRRRSARGRTRRPRRSTRGRSRRAHAELVGRRSRSLIRTGGERRISNFLLWGSRTPSCTSRRAVARLRTPSDLYEAVAATRRASDASV